MGVVEGRDGVGVVGLDRYSTWALVLVGSQRTTGPAVCPGLCNIEVMPVDPDPGIWVVG